VADGGVILHRAGDAKCALHHVGPPLVRGCSITHGCMDHQVHGLNRGGHGRAIVASESLTCQGDLGLLGMQRAIASLLQDGVERHANLCENMGGATLEGLYVMVRRLSGEGGRARAHPCGAGCRGMAK
jgi:hypothetical protein